MDATKKVIVFDFDGVIFDSAALSFELTQEEFPDVTYQEFKDLHKENIHEAIKKSALRRKAEWAEEEKAHRDAHSIKKQHVSMYEGIKEVIAALSKKYTLVINTSAPTRNCVPILERNGINEYFDFVASKEVALDKVEKFKMISEKYNVPLSDLIFITDTVGDIKEANKAGIPTIVVTYGYHTAEDFVDAPKDNILGFADKPADLLKFFAL